MHAFKTFKNIIALQDIQIIYLSRPFLFPPLFSHLNLDSIKIAKFAVMIFILSSKNVKKKKKKKIKLNFFKEYFSLSFFFWDKYFS